MRTASTGCTVIPLLYCTACTIVGHLSSSGLQLGYLGQQLQVMLDFTGRGINVSLLRLVWEEKLTHSGKFSFGSRVVEKADI